MASLARPERRATLRQSQPWGQTPAPTGLAKVRAWVWVILGVGLDQPPASLDDCSSRIHWEYISEGFLGRPWNGSFWPLLGPRNSFIHSLFIQQIFIECLLCAGNCPRPQGRKP